MNHTQQELQKILDEYTIEGGRITNPGRFEGEPLWTPYFWNLALDGQGESLLSDDEEEEFSIDCFVVLSEEAECFGLEPGQKVAVRQDDNGFVYGWTLEEENK